MNNSSSLVYSSDIASGLLPSSINVYITSVHLQKDIRASQKVDFPLKNGRGVASTEDMQE